MTTRVAHPENTPEVSLRGIFRLPTRRIHSEQRVPSNTVKRNPNRKNFIQEVAKRKVLKDIKIDPKLSVVKLAAEISRIMGRSVSAETVRNMIRHAGYIAVE
ncbi:hypothetical protein TNCV_518841 [Trichonephila clavipes]|nr:hypothetical protein TNCV_518841 [Trichonephila clavipes]